MHRVYTTNTFSLSRALSPSLALARSRFFPTTNNTPLLRRCGLGVRFRPQTVVVVVVVVVVSQCVSAASVANERTNERTNDNELRQTDSAPPRLRSLGAY